jgi:CheY-like chemotaxis protein
VQLKIVRQPSGTVDGIDLSHFTIGTVFEVGTVLAMVLLVEGWAEPVAEATATTGSNDVGRIRGTVLVVEDDKGTCELVSSILSEVGFKVLTALNGQEGLAQLRVHHPDLVLLDLRMPGVDGWQFRHLQERLPTDLATTPVVLLTGIAHAEEEVEELHAAALVSKPFDDADLVNAVRQHARLPRHR